MFGSLSKFEVSTITCNKDMKAGKRQNFKTVTWP